MIQLVRNVHSFINSFNLSGGLLCLRHQRCSHKQNSLAFKRKEQGTVKELCLCFLRREVSGSTQRAPEAQVWLGLEACFSGTFPNLWIPGGAGDLGHGCSKSLRAEWRGTLPAPHSLWSSQLPLCLIAGGFSCSVPGFLSPPHQILPRT